MERKLSDESFRYLIDLIRSESADSRREMQEGFGKLEGMLDDQDKRIIKVEQFNWRLTAICVGVLVIAELAFRIAEVTLGKA